MGDGRGFPPSRISPFEFPKSGQTLTETPTTEKGGAAGTSALKPPPAPRWPTAAYSPAGDGRRRRSPSARPEREDKCTAGQGRVSREGVRAPPQS